MAELIVEGEAKTADISAFNIERFSEGKMLEGKHSYENIWR
jgi:hypothetical protein